MREGQASSTADRVAERRAAHQLIDRPIVFHDPLAMRIIRPESAAALTAHPESADSSPIAKYLRAFLAVRSRLAEEQLAHGFGQYVLLGAGFDTFAYRNDNAQLAVYEVDHPATQAVKKERLAAAGIAIPDNLRFVAVDFTRDSLQESLFNAGFDRTQPGLFAWLGVVPYLTIDEIRLTLQFIASLAAGTAVVFDYGLPPASLPFVARQIYKEVERRVAAIGEPWKTYFEPEQLANLLHELGFKRIEDFSPHDLTAKYGVKLGPSGRIAVATL